MGTIKTRWGTGFVALSLALLALPASAETKHVWKDLFVYPQALASLIVAGIVCYLLALGITGIFGAKGFPPSVARVGCFLGALLWVVWILFGILKAVLHLFLPFYVLLLVLCAVALFGLLLAATRPRVVAH